MEDEKTKKSKVGIIITLIVVVVIIFVPPAIPAFLESVIFRNDIYSVLSNGEWASFLGSYIGGILGGLGTLFAVYTTTKQTRDIQDKNIQLIKQDRKIYERKERKAFADDIAENVAKYITEINVYVYTCTRLKELDKNKQELEGSLEGVNLKIKDLQKCKENTDVLGDETQQYIEIENKIESLMTEQNNFKDKLQELLRNIDKYNVDRKVANECYFLLKIKLNGVIGGEKILEQIESIHNMQVDTETYIVHKFIEEETAQLSNITVQFISQYVGN